MAKARPARKRTRTTAAGAKKRASVKKRTSKARGARAQQPTVRARQRAARPSGQTGAAKPAPASRTRAPESTLGTAAAAVGRAIGRTVEAVTRPFGGSDRDALTLLETDHRRLETLLKQGEEMTDRAVNSRMRLLDTITSELQMHEQIEEEILYPALKVHAEATATVLEGYQEHHVADILVKELHALAPDDERWGAKFKVLKENIEHHIQEEEGEMFGIARTVLSRAEREELGDRMRVMKGARQ